MFFLGFLKNDCVRGFGKQMCHVSSAVVVSWTWVTQACHARSPTKSDERCSRAAPFLPPSSRRPAPVASESLPDICNPTARRKRVVSCLTTVTISKSLEGLAREVGWVRGQHTLAREEDSETSDESGPVACADRDITDCFMDWSIIWCAICDVGKSEEESLLERRGVRTLAARLDIIRLLSDRLSNSSRNAQFFCSQTAKSTVPWLRVPTIAFSGESSITIVFKASCCSDGSLAVIQPLWFQKTSEVSSLLERMATAHATTSARCRGATSQHLFVKGIAAQPTLLNQPGKFFISHLTGDQRCVRQSFWH